jgi:nucleoside transporter
MLPGSRVELARAARPPAPDWCPMQTRLKVQLSAFMFLQYFIWGSWYVSMGTYLAKVLQFGGQEIGAAYGAFAIGAMISPFFVGLVADRYFASEKMLGVLGLAGGVVLCVLPQSSTFAVFYPLLILYCALYVPTLALGNSLALHHLADAKRDFPRVKSLSAVGWIAGGVTLSLIGGEQSAAQFYLASGLSIAFGLFAFTLPHTPPKKVGADVSVGEVLGLDALGLLKKRSFAVFVACMFLICVPLYFYFVCMHIYLGQLQWTYITARMSLAQVSDVVFLILLPVMLWRLGYKTTIAIGILAWAARYFLLARSVGSPAEAQVALIFAAILLHGVCYDFLFIAGQLYVDDEANERMRGAAQGFIAFILWGVGAFVGTMLAGAVMAAHKYPSPVGMIEHDWAGIWIVPAVGSAAVLVIFLLFFREPRKPAAVPTTEAASPPGEGTP